MYFVQVNVFLEKKYKTNATSEFRAIIYDLHSSITVLIQGIEKKVLGVVIVVPRVVVPGNNNRFAMV